MNRFLYSALLLVLAATFVFFSTSNNAYATGTQASCESNDNYCWDTTLNAGAGGCVTNANWSPPRSQYCNNATYTPSSSACNGAAATRPINGSATPITSGDVCSGSSYTQTCRNSSGNFVTVNGTENPTIFSPGQSSVCRGVKYNADPTNCLHANGFTVQTTGTKDSTGWTPDASTYCTDVNLIQTGDCTFTDPADNQTKLGYSAAKAQGVSDGSNPHRRTGSGSSAVTWSPDPSNYCQNETFEQSAECLGLAGQTYRLDDKGTASVNDDQIVNNSTGQPMDPETDRRTKNTQGTLSESTEFTPDPSQVCSGTNFTQTGLQCGETRNATGTMGSQEWQPPVDEVCEGETFLQESSCSNGQTDANGELIYPSQSTTGTKTDGECCVPTSFSPDLGSFCPNETKNVTDSCGVTQPRAGTSTAASCCDEVSWSPSPTTVCDGESFTQTSNCGNTRSMTGTKKTGSCSDSDSDCLPGLPCWKVLDATENYNLPSFNPASPFDGNIKSNTSGPHANKAPNDLCDANIMNQIYGRAHIEAAREKAIIQTVIPKPDSVLEYSCFKSFVNVAAMWSPRTFSETKIWSEEECADDQGLPAPFNVSPLDLLSPKCNTTLGNAADSYEVEIDGFIDNVEQDPIILDVYMGDGLNDDETRLGNNLQRVVMKSLNQYLNEDKNFDHTLGGGRVPSLNNSVDGEVEPAAVYLCAAMTPVWYAAQCENYGGQTNPVREFELLFPPSADMRMYPYIGQTGTWCSVSQTEWTKQRQIAMNRVNITGTGSATTRTYPYAGVDGSAYVHKGTSPSNSLKYGDFLTPDKCVNPIPTGIEVTVVKEFVRQDMFSSLYDSEEETYEEHICPNPNCFYDYENNACVKEP